MDVKEALNKEMTPDLCVIKIKKLLGNRQTWFSGSSVGVHVGVEEIARIGACSHDTKAREHRSILEHVGVCNEPKPALSSALRGFPRVPNGPLLILLGLAALFCSA